MKFAASETTAAHRAASCGVLRLRINQESQILAACLLEMPSDSISHPAPARGHPGAPWPHTRVHEREQPQAGPGASGPACEGGTRGCEARWGENLQDVR